MQAGRKHIGVLEREAEQGFMLVGLIVAIFLILLALSVAAPKVARDLRREREVEAVHRGNQYVRAIRLFYLKNGSMYPGSIEQLEQTNNVRFLRQRYIDPMTGKSDWRLIKVGEAKTTVKGFFGQPLAGIGGAPGGLGSASGMASPGGTGTPAGASPSAFGAPSAFGTPGGQGSGSAFGSSSPGSPGATPGAGGAPGGTNTPGGASGAGGQGTGSSFGSGSGIGSQSATSFTGSGAPFVGVGSSAMGDSIIVLNEQKTYPTWEFLYDPRIEQLKAKASLFGGGPASGGSGLGSAGSLGSSFGTGNGSPGAGGAGAGGTTGSSFGSGSGGFGTGGTGTTNGSSPGTTQPPASGAPPPQ